MRTALLALTLFCASLGSAQTLVKLEFTSSPERTPMSEPLRELVSENPCTIVVEMSIDRNGHVFRSQALAPLSDCADLGVMVKAAELARQYSFEPSSDAPAEQKARVTWRVGDVLFDDVAVPEAPAMIAEPPQQEVYEAALVEEQPEFPGGQQAMMSYLAKNLRYTEEMSEYQGKVFVEFTVQKDGAVANVKVVRGVNSSLDKEAVRVVKSMPKWTPGRLNGRPVPVRYILPIVFKLG